MKLKIVFGEHGKADRFFRDGKQISRREYQRLARQLSKTHAHHVVPGHVPGAGYPMKSEALAVHPAQVAEANERNKRLGIAVTYEPGTGRAVIPSRHERNKLIRAEGCFDRDAGYSDPTPNR